MAPDSIGRYQIESFLGRGGMSVVYLATDPRMKRYVAVKLLPVHLQNQPRLPELFQKEAELVASLEHPCIVPIYDFGQHEEQPYLVMRYLAGGSLQEKLNEGAFTPSTARPLLKRISQALDTAHAKNIIHRDLKPGNILFDDQNNGYLSDFGIAKVIEASLSYTNSGVLGTPAYMSPEQANGSPVTPQSDVYSLGALLFYTLTGQPPYQADTPVALALKHLTDPVPSILTVKQDLPAGFEALIKQAMAKDPAERFASAGEFFKAYEDVLAGRAFTAYSDPINQTDKIAPAALNPENPPLTAKAEPETPPQPASSPKPVASKRLIWVGAVGLLTLLGLLAFFGLNNGFLAPPITQGNALAMPSETATHTATHNPPPTTPLPTDTATATLEPSPSPTQTATPTLTPSPSPTVSPTSPPSPSPSPTTATSRTAQLTAPTLTSPMDGASFALPVSPVLRWQALKPTLAEDEQYLITIRFQSNQGEWTDYAWTQETQWDAIEHRYLVDNSIDGRFEWRVSLIQQTTTNEQGVPQGPLLSQPSTPRRFEWRIANPSSPSDNRNENSSPP